MSKKNFTISTVTTAPSPATSGTSLVVATGTGSLFALNEPAIIFPTNNQPLVSNAEIVMVTNISSDTLTITRTQEGTSAREIVAGDMIIQGITAKDWNDLVTLASQALPKTVNITSIDDTGIADGEVAIFDLTNKKIKTSDKTLPTGAIVGTTDTQTLTNKTLDGNNNTLKHIIPAGSITMYGGSTAPTGYLLCDGSAVSRTTYADLFTAIGTTYGTGDGSTTFNVPNVKGKVPVGRDSGDTSFDTLGETGGVKDVKLTSAQSGLPAHKHPFVIHTAGTGNLYAAISSATAVDNALTENNTAQNASEAHTNLQPYIVFNYIIKT